MTERLITRVGRALFGDSWMGPLSRETGIRRNTIDDWDKGRSEPAVGVYERLAGMVEGHLDHLERRAAHLRAVLGDLRATIARRRPQNPTSGVSGSGSV